MRRLGKFLSNLKKKAFVFAPFMLAIPSTVWAQVGEGNFNVGTTHFQFTDESRTEPFEAEADKKRDVFVQAWYPADEVQGATKLPYVTDASQNLGIIKSLFRLDDAFMKRFEALETNAFADVPISKRNRKYPLLIFQHGYSFWMNQNSALMEHLAGQGYIVVSIAHAYETCYGVGKEGARSFTLANPGLQARWSEILDEEISKDYATLMDSPFSDETIKIEEKLLRLQPKMQESVMLWARDASFVLDQLKGLNRTGASVLSNRIDLKKVGAFGMSFGGAATGQFMVFDKRVKAGLNMDGAMFGDLISRPVDRPFLFMVSGNHGGLNELHYRQAKAAAYKLTITGSKHLDFCDLNLLSPEFFQQAGLMGEIDKSRMNEILKTYTLSFFDRHLRSMKGDFPNNADYPEIKLKKRNIK